jgi:hypothetical protein
MRQKWSSAVVVIGLAVCELAAAQEQAPAPSGVPRLELSTQEWNFGEAWQGQPLKHEITLKNVGDASLEILDVRTSCGCTTPTRPKSPLAPGESSTMTISYDSAKRVGPANHTITLTTNDPSQPSVVIQLVGNVKPVYEIDPRDGLVFGQLYQNSAETRTIQILNKYKDKMLVELKQGQEFGPFQMELKAIEPGMRYALSATTRPPLDVGRYQVNVVLTTSVELVPEIPVLVYAFVQPPVAVRPEKLFLPKNMVSEMKRVLRVSHAPDQPVEVTGVRSTHPAIKVELEAVKPPAGEKAEYAYRIMVTLPPGDRIPEGAEPQIEITTNSKDPRYQKLTVPVEPVSPHGSEPAERRQPVESQPGVPGPKQDQLEPASRPAG